MHSRYSHENIGKLNIRALNYVKKNFPEAFFGMEDYRISKIILYYPISLISATLYRVSITNLNECTNLQNLYTIENTYDEGSLSNLTKLKRFYSIRDTYAGFCLIFDIFT